MALRISSELHLYLLAVAAASPEAEVCGLLIGNHTDDCRVHKIVPARNVASDPARSFEIDPTTLFDAIRRERAGQGCLLGYYHSHPVGSPAPSPRDVAQAVPDGRVWLIIGDGRLTAWRMTESSQFNALDVLIVD
jgi:desampylase